MSPHTPTQPPNDAGMWRRLVARAHPDAGGTHDLFIWASATRVAVCGGELGAEIPRQPTEPREERPPRRRSPDTADRVDFTAAYDKAESFQDLTRQAVDLADSGVISPLYASLLRLLSDCYEADEGEPVLYRQQNQGATYKQLAAIAHSLGWAKPERVNWYRIAESIPLSQRHAGHMLGYFKRRAA